MAKKSRNLPVLTLYIFLAAFSAVVFFFGREVLRISAAERNIVPENYIVVLRDDAPRATEVAPQMALEHGLSIAVTYSHALNGFSAVIPAAKLDRVKSDPRVKFVSQDRMVFALVSQSGRGGGRPTPTQPPQPVQTTPYGISRIGSSANKGSGIGVAVIDTGIDLTHPDLAANISGNYSCLKGTKTGTDDNGHGTHVAGTIAAIDNNIGVVGVAPQADLYAVKVLGSNGSGTWSSVICGIDWVTANADKIKVANLSLGGLGTSDDNCGNTNGDALHLAICNSRDRGITYVVAAGNEGDDSANHVPAAYNDAVITVSALIDADGQPGGLAGQTSFGLDDTFASFSNFGTVVDVGAPGVNILSTWLGGKYNTISGTSMATPHAAGAAALYLSANSGSTWAQVRDGLRNNGEALNSGHTDPSGKHPEPVVKVF